MPLHFELTEELYRVIGACPIAVDSLQARQVQVMPPMAEESLDEICLEAKKQSFAIWLVAKQQRLQSTFDELAIQHMRNYNRGKTILPYNTIQAYLRDPRLIPTEISDWRHTNAGH